MTLGQRLQQLLDEFDESQVQLAAFLGIPKQTLHGWIKDLREPPHQVLKKIADHYSVSVDYLLGRTNVRTPNPPPGIDPIEHLDLWLRGVATKDDIDAVRDFLEVRRKRRQAAQQETRTDD